MYRAIIFKHSTIFRYFSYNFRILESFLQRYFIVWYFFYFSFISYRIIYTRIDIGSWNNFYRYTILYRILAIHIYYLSCRECNLIRRLPITDDIEYFSNFVRITFDWKTWYFSSFFDNGICKLNYFLFSSFHFFVSHHNIYILHYGNV